MKIKVWDDDNRVIEKRHINSFDDFQEILYEHREKFK